MLDEAMQKTLASIRRVDENGYLYEMDYTADYYDAAITSQLGTVQLVDAGCSVFSALNPKGEALLCRNYDYKHLDASGNVTGLNVVVRTSPKGKLRSLNVCDAYWIEPKSYYAGALDDGKTDTTRMLLCPYVCVDGMNEAGVTASLLVADIREGESHVNQKTGKERITYSVLLRHIMDNAHDLSEAVDIAKRYDIFTTIVSDLHMYVADRKGNSCVFEWRNNELRVTYTNVCTNFYVGFDDAQDMPKERFTHPTNTVNDYHYGYGHGYHRFGGIVTALERYLVEEPNEHGVRNSQISEKQAKAILAVASQDPGTEKTSLTQYSAIFNLKTLSTSFWVHRDYEKEYTFA